MYVYVYLRIPERIILHMLPLVVFKGITICEHHGLIVHHESVRHLHPRLRRVHGGVIDGLNLSGGESHRQRRRRGGNASSGLRRGGVGPEPQGRLVRRHAYVVGIVADGARQRACELGEVQSGVAATEMQRRHVVGGGGHLQRLETAEPNPGLGSGLADFGDPLAPFSLAHSSVRRRRSANMGWTRRRHVHAKSASKLWNLSNVIHLNYKMFFAVLWIVIANVVVVDAVVVVAVVMCGTLSLVFIDVDAKRGSISNILILVTFLVGASFALCFPTSFPTKSMSMFFFCYCSCYFYFGFDWVILFALWTIMFFVSVGDVVVIKYWRFFVSICFC